MARKPKVGLDYFPLDVGFFQDLKVRKLRRLHGPVGLVVYLNLLCRVYGCGCQLKFNELEDLAFDIAEEITSDKMSRDSSKIARVILDIGNCGLIDKALLEKGVITSDSIQQQYSIALKKSRRVLKNYNKDYEAEKNKNTSVINLNLEEKPINEEEITINTEEKPIIAEDMQQNKINKNKLNENINNYILSKSDNWIESKFEKFWAIYPRKEGKKKCLDWFKRNKPNEEFLNKMLSAIHKQKQSDKWTREKGRFIPMPFTWLNQGRWDDEVEDEINLDEGKGFLKDEEYI